jgi:site-specific recombinase XerD
MVQQMLGHSRLDTTGIYTKANPINTIQKAWESF